MNFVDVPRIDKIFLVMLFLVFAGCGEPEHVGGGDQPRPPKEKPILEPTFQSIYENVIVPKCLQCHAPGKSVQRIPLVTYEDFLNSPLDLVIPGVPEESGLYISVALARPEKIMPPRLNPDGQVNPDSPLSEAEIQSIYQWISLGAQN